MSGLGAPPTILGLLGHPQTLRNWTTHGLHRFRVSNLNLLEIYSKNVSLTCWFGVSEAVQYKWTSNSQYSILRGLETESAKSSLGFPNDLIEGHRFENLAWRHWIFWHDIIPAPSVKAAFVPGFRNFETVRDRFSEFVPGIFQEKTKIYPDR